MKIQYSWWLKWVAKYLTTKSFIETETLNYFKPGGYVFFQRLKEYGGGYWLGKIYEDGFEFVLERPTSLSEGIKHLLVLKALKMGIWNL